ncbi:helix-turn-helix domain-containing protein [Spartinivicinus ruber]|uniref:helix-turn-helix domain-containing protein n=1 Tax=Spartinivicinus ruber TaxID=2683272 RepID=UPI0013D5F40E|nr:XRE family transcriptional regulator [Spartinivicinus ruber]
MEFVTVRNPYLSSSKTEEEAVDKLMRAQLLVVLRKLIIEQGLTQTDAAEVLGITQPRVSDIINGKISVYTVEKLMFLLFKLGWRFDFSYENGKVSIESEKINSQVA